MRIVVLAGGLSPERNVSLSSGTMIAQALERLGHRVALVGTAVKKAAAWAADENRATLAGADRVLLVYGEDVVLAAAQCKGLYLHVALLLTGLCTMFILGRRNDPMTQATI